MPPVNRRNPSPGPRRRPVVAGARQLRADPPDPGAVTLVDERVQTETPTVPAAAPPASDDAHPTASGAPARPRRAGTRLPLLLLGLAALMLIAAIVVGVVTFVGDRGPGQDAASASNAALIDAPGTQQVGAATVDILQKVYSYTYTTIDTDSKAAVALMTPEMAAQYQPLFDNIRKAATQAKTTTKATVVSDGVRLLNGDRAEVLAYVEVTGDNGGTALQPSGYRFTASMLRTNGKWMLSGLTES